MSLVGSRFDIYHICSEIIALTGIIVYINRKNRTLLSHIEELIRRNETQEDTINNHNVIIQTLLSSVSELKKTVSELKKDNKKLSSEIRRINNSIEETNSVISSDTASNVSSTPRYRKETQYSSVYSSKNKETDNPVVMETSSCPFVNKNFGIEREDYVVSRENNFGINSSLPSGSFKTFNFSNKNDAVFNGVVLQRSQIPVNNFPETVHKLSDLVSSVKKPEVPINIKKDEDDTNKKDDENLDDELKHELAELKTTSSAV